jgi:RNA polymerase sigma factor (sigma-70 family)
LKHFDNIYVKNYQLIFNVVQKMTGNIDDTSDIVQETFIALYQSFQKKVEINYPRSWLYKVAVNKSLIYLRQYNNNDNIEQVKNHPVEENDIEKSEQQKMVQLALNKLKPDEKVLAVLYSEGMSYREMSEISGIKFTSIGKTLSRTIVKLGEELKKTEL